MKQARKWLPIAAALMLLPQAALAQKAGGKKPAAPTPAPSSSDIELDTPATPAAPAAGTAGGSTAGGEIDATPAPAPGAAAPAGGAPGAMTGGICDIDPTACPKESDIGKAASKTVAAEVYAVQQIYALRYHRLELKPYWSFTLNDQFVSHPGPGLDINFYITNVLAIGLNGNFYGGLNQDSSFNFEVRRSARVATPLNEYREGANFNFTYVPIYGKFAGFSKFIFHYDAYLVGGVGFIDTRAIPVIDPDNRNFTFKQKLDFDVGIGLRISSTAGSRPTSRSATTSTTNSSRTRASRRRALPATEAPTRPTRAPGTARAASRTTFKPSSESASSFRSAGSTGCPNDRPSNERSLQEQHPTALA